MTQLPFWHFFPKKWQFAYISPNVIEIYQVVQKLQGKRRTYVITVNGHIYPTTIWFKKKTRYLLLQSLPCIRFGLDMLSKWKLHTEFANQSLLNCSIPFPFHPNSIPPQNDQVQPTTESTLNLFYVRSVSLLVCDLITEFQSTFGYKSFNQRSVVCLKSVLNCFNLMSDTLESGPSARE